MSTLSAPIGLGPAISGSAASYEVDSNHQQESPISTVFLLGGVSDERQAVLTLLEQIASEVTAFEDPTQLQSVPARDAAESNAAPHGGGAPPQTAPPIPACLIVAGPAEEAVDAGHLQRLRRDFPAIPIVVACNDPAVDSVIGALQQGASEVLLLGKPQAELQESLRRTLQLGEAAASRLRFVTDLTTRLKKLTPAEHQVLDAILDGMANKQIAQLLEIGLRTVELRRSKIMRKMEAKSLAELVKFVCIAKGLTTADA